MIAGFGKVTTLSDMSANMFAAFLLILIVEISTAAGSMPSEKGDQRMVEHNKLLLVPQRPLGPAALIQLFYDRRATAEGGSLDLFKTRVVLTSSRGGAASLRGPDMAAKLRSQLSPIPRAVRLYVFANDLYNPVVAALDEEGVPHQEASVPVALRDTALDGWSANFTQLLRTSENLPEFREGLAKILNGGERFDSSSDPARPTDQMPLSALAERVLGFLRELLVGLSIAAAVLSVLWIEVRTRRNA